MKYKILRRLFEKNQQFFTDLLVEEFTKNIPDKVEEGAIEVLATKRRKVEKWILSAAYQIQRKSMIDISRIQFYQGQLTTLKVILYLIGKVEYQSKKEVINIGETESMDDYKERLKGVESFKKGPVKK